MNWLIRSTVSLCILATSVLHAEEFLVEAESFAGRGGWKLDTQFIQEMGSPYLLAHGLGRPVEDATTTVQVPRAGKYRVWVRTKDWVARWNASPPPGKFQLKIGKDWSTDALGTNGAKWDWQDAGWVDLEAGPVDLRLHDLTGFDGRCDCIHFNTDGDQPPPNESEVLSDWRREQLGIGREPTDKGPYDLVVIGGGYAGIASAISAARMGCRVALIQDRPVLGGNGSSEVRVWAMGNIRRGKYPRIGEIVEEFCDHATKSPGTYEEFGDELKERVVRAEDKIDLMLNHHAHDVEQDGNTIQAVLAFDTQTGAEVRVSGKLFADCTGHGWIGAWSGADLDMTPEDRMGMSNMWAWAELADETTFPETPWALDLQMADFPYPRDHHGQWFWESGFDKDAIGDAEGIRDWNLRAVYGAFNAMKNRDGAADHSNAILTWVAYIGGPRESRRLMGDVVLNQDDIVSKKDFLDGMVPSTWSIDLHYPKEQYTGKYPDNPFISKAVHNRSVDRNYGYPVPYRCFYSRNVSNLFMAGRCASVTHEALGTVRVMKTCGMMGEVVGKAASLCVLHDCKPRAVYDDHLDDLIKLLHIPGKARRESPGSEIIIPEDALASAGPYGPPTGKNPRTMKGIVVDDNSAKLTGTWQTGTGLKNYVGSGYRYASPESNSTATFIIKPEQTGKHVLRFASQPHKNRSKKTSVLLRRGSFERTYVLDQSSAYEDDMIEVAEIDISDLSTMEIVVSAGGADGLIHIDAVQLQPVGS